MYHSYIVVDTGGNPDRPRPGRRWIGNIYNVHQRLSMGFPNNNQFKDDPFFLDKFKPAGFTNNGSDPDLFNVKRKSSNRPDFLFRIENKILGDINRAVICIQSKEKPNWEYAFQNARILLAQGIPVAEPKEYKPQINNGDSFRFKVNMNLCKKSAKYKTKDGTGKQGKRVSLTWDEAENKETVIKEWFINKIEQGQLGFKVNELNVDSIGWKYGWKHFRNNDKEYEQKPHTLKFRSALLEGTLGVTNSDAFLKVLQSGIGSAKAFGFGLLSIARY